MRIFVTMLGYNRAEVVHGAMENLEATTTDSEHRRLIKTLFLCQYPIPSVEENRAELLKIGAEFGFWTTEIQNEGGLENHNKAIHDYYRMLPGDYYICFDPDVRMQEKGWISAMVEALESDRDTVFVCASRHFHNDEWCYKHHGRTIHTLPSGLRISRYNQLLAWSMGMWKGEWLAKRPRDFKAACKWYGYFEHADIALMNKHGKTWCETTDFYDNHIAAEELYTEWKVASAGHHTKVSFNEWLVDKR